MNKNEQNSNEPQNQQLNTPVVIKSLPSDGDIEKEAEVYATNLDFSNDSQLNEKGRQRVAEWCKQDFIAGAKYMRGLAEGIDCVKFTLVV